MVHKILHFLSHQGDGDEAFVVKKLDMAKAYTELNEVFYWQ